MNTHTLVLYATLSAVIFSACIKVEAPPVDKNPWQKLSLSVERPLQNAHVTPDALFFITQNEFFRLDRSLNLIEKRTLNANFEVNGTPALSHNVFARLTKTNQGKQKLEFHLTKSGAEVVEFTTDDLTASSGETLEIDFQGSQIGAFNPDGTKFILAARNLSRFHYSFFIFELQLDAQTFHFESVKIARKVDVEDMKLTFNNVGTLRFLDGNFYVASKQGGFRITPDGQTSKMSAGWVKDFFIFGGKIYATGFENADFFVSENSGLTFARNPRPSELKVVETGGGKVVSHEFPGWSYYLASDDLLNATPILGNENFPDNNNAFFFLTFFENNFFISVGKEVYYAAELKTQ